MAIGLPLLHEGLRLDAAGRAALTQAAGREHRYLLLLSHMRSYSSVLAHLLGSAPAIEGYGESQLRYRWRLDLWRLARTIQRSTGEPLSGPWLLDKVLHNRVKPLDRLVEPERVRALIFLRRPERALQSLMALAASKGPGEAYNDAQACCDYYVSRLHRLREDGRRLGRRALYFDAEAVVQRPQALLDAIGHWLGVALPSALDYRVRRRSGDDGFGDFSANIRAGHVLGEERSTIERPRPLPAAVLSEAEAAWLRCRGALLHHCDTVPAGLAHRNEAVPGEKNLPVV